MKMNPVISKKLHNPQTICNWRNSAFKAVISISSSGLMLSVRFDYVVFGCSLQARLANCSVLKVSL
jgi:hypothetical protein